MAVPDRVVHLPAERTGRVRVLGPWEMAAQRERALLPGVNRVG